MSFAEITCFYQSKQLNDYVYTDIYCKLSKCIGQTPCSFKHYLVVKNSSCETFAFNTVVRWNELDEMENVSRSQS